MIKLSNITKVFQQGNRSIQALNNVSLHVPAGQIYGVIGASGAGKSTLIRCVNLLERPTEGSVQVDGQELTALSEKELTRARRQIGMIFQHFNLLASRTVFGNVALPLELDNTPQAEIKRRVTELLDLVGLGDKHDSYPANLSGGQKQRVAIARALASNPKVLLCDEATSALDPATTRSILELLKDINRRLGLTILLITHEMDVVKRICDCVAVISNGQLIEQDTVSEVFSHPKTPLAQQFQQELYLRIFRNQPYQDYVRETIARLMNGELDEQLVYRKRLRRPLAEYQRNVPPHVRAARLADEHNLKLGRAQQYQQRGTIKYVWTTSGPEPVDYQQSPLDYDHYLTKQLQPVAEGILPFVNDDFATIVTGQLGLF